MGQVDSLPRPTALSYWYADFLFLLEEGHHLTKLAAHDFDLVVVALFAHRQELLAPRLVLLDPLPREFAGLDFAENFLHLRARLVIDHARPASVVAVLGRVADAVTHIAQAAFLY